MTLRHITPADVAAVARLWHDGWHQAHAAHVPRELVDQRTYDAFLIRASALDTRARVIGPVGAPLGMCDILDDELNQLFVTPAGRGTGLAATLLSDGEARLATSGVTRAHLFCVPQNERAVRFYTRAGWTDVGLQVMQPPECSQAINITCIRFEKDVAT